jgi:hypothetical protein
MLKVEAIQQSRDLQNCSWQKIHYSFLLAYFANSPLGIKMVSEWFLLLSK